MPGPFDRVADAGPGGPDRALRASPGGAGTDGTDRRPAPGWCTGAAAGVGAGADADVDEADPSVLALIKAAIGNVSLSSMLTGVSRVAVRQRRAEGPDLARTLGNATIGFVDPRFTRGGSARSFGSGRREDA